LVGKLFVMFIIVNNSTSAAVSTSFDNFWGFSSTEPTKTTDCFLFSSFALSNKLIFNSKIYTFGNFDSIFFLSNPYDIETKKSPITIGFNSVCFGILIDMCVSK
jgi:hypothetical protein